MMKPLVHMDKKRPLVHLSTVLCILAMIAVPLPGTLALRHKKVSVLMEVPYQVVTRRMMAHEKASVNHPMDIELHDYPISGANSRHDPKSPGKP